MVYVNFLSPKRKIVLRSGGSIVYLEQYMGEEEVLISEYVSEELI